jgi:AcrR family transcriptional regulator
LNQEWSGASHFDAFHALEPEKQKRVIDAALVEFAEKGFKRASTNAIAEKAQVGKGMLFYYFGSKLELFEFLCEYTIEFAKTRYLSEFRFETGDFLERYRKLTEIKRRALAEYTLPAAFFESFYKEGGGEYSPKYASEANALRAQLLDEVYSGLDYSLFRGDIDGRAAVKYIKWLFDAYQREVNERYNRGEFSISDEAALAEEWTRFDTFCGDLRKLFYKEADSDVSN